MALYVCGISVELREVVLKNKPASMLHYSKKGSVPVLVFENGRVIDESIDIVNWALSVHDPEQLKSGLSKRETDEVQSLQGENDYIFKSHLDRYKYADRHPEGTREEYQKHCLSFISALELKLEKTKFLIGDKRTVADIVIMPFIRQFAHVDKKWFDDCEYHQVKRWLYDEIEGETFSKIMKKYPAWEPEQTQLIFP